MIGVSFFCSFSFLIFFQEVMHERLQVRNVKGLMKHGSREAPLHNSGHLSIRSLIANTLNKLGSISRQEKGVGIGGESQHIYICICIYFIVELSTFTFISLWGMEYTDVDYTKMLKSISRSDKTWTLQQWGYLSYYFHCSLFFENCNFIHPT